MNKERNYGIDLLRIVAMAMIIISHFCIHGLSKLDVNSAYKSLIDCCKLGNLGVVIFIMISGYYYESKFKFSKLLKLIITVLFYSIGIFMLFLLLTKYFSKEMLLGSLFPIHSNTYWFITVYLIIYASSPFIKRLIDVLDKKIFSYMLFAYILIMILDPFITKKVFTNMFYMNDLIELLIYYLIGAFMKKYGIELINNKKRKFFVFVTIPAILILSTVVLNQIGISYSNILFYRNSPLIILLSIGLIELFLEFKINNSMFNIITPHILSVYLIHDNPIIRKYLWNYIIDLFGNTIVTPLILLIIPIVAIAIFVICILVDIIREFIIDKKIMKNYIFLSKWEEKCKILFY